MAFARTNYRTTNPGTNTRSFDITAVNADTAITFAHSCGWTPDSWSITATDGSACDIVGQWTAQVSATNVILTKVLQVAGSGGAIRLTLVHGAIRP